MSRPIPILLNHDVNRVIGKATWNDGRLTVSMNEGHHLTKDQLYNMVGSVGIVITKQTFNEGQPAVVEEFEVMEWSLQA
jgi:hypothetical protein